jgi:hypothetical protein
MLRVIKQLPKPHILMQKVAKPKQLVTDLTQKVIKRNLLMRQHMLKDVIQQPLVDMLTQKDIIL